MFTILALLCLIAVTAGFIVVPFRFPALSTRLAVTLERRLLGGRVQTAFSRPGSRDRERLLRLRAWAVLSVLVLFVGSLGPGGVTGNHPDSVPAVFVWAGIGALTSCLMLAALFACATYVPRARGYSALAREGFRSLWNVASEIPPHGLLEALGARVKGSSRVSILDVTGFELLGKGPGRNGGLLYDTLSTLTATPVQILLLEPDARVLDPDQKHATVYQTILAEMEGTPVTFHRKLKSTLGAIEALNASRPAEGRISVRFYAAKPCFRMILFDDSVMVLPPFSRENQADLPVVELGRTEAPASFFEGFRRHLSWLWSTSSPAEKALQVLNARASSVVRRQQQVATPQT